MAVRRIVAVLRPTSGSQPIRGSSRPVMRSRHWSRGARRASSRAISSGSRDAMSGVHAPKSSQSRRRIGGWLFDQPYLLLSLTSLFWAGNTVLGRFVAGHVPPITLAFIRWAAATLILLPFAARHLIRDWPVIRKHAGAADPDRVHRFLRLQHDGLLRPAIHDRDQRAVAAIGRAAVRRDVDVRAVRRPADAAPGRRHRRVAHRRRRHHLSRQSRRAASRSNSIAATSVSLSRSSSTASTRPICASGRPCIRCRFSPSAWASARRC